LGEVGGDAGLAHAEDLTEFSDREFFLAQEQEEAQAGVVCEEPERFED
jgi:hypothetical protein